MIIRRYSFSWSLWVFISIPSATWVTQDGKSRFVPLISTKQNRQAPTSVTPSKWHKVGMRILVSFAAFKIVEPSSIARSTPFIFKLCSIIPMPAVLIKMPSHLPFSTTFVSSVTIFIVAF